MGDHPLKPKPMDISRLLGTMTLQEKIGQMFLLAFSGNRLDEARHLMEEHLVGAAYISNDNIPTAKAAARLTRTLQSYAANTRLKIPLLLGVDQEGSWAVMVPDSSPGPGNMALGSARDPGLTHEMYGIIARELTAVGLNTLFAPCCDCNSNPDNSIIGMRSFGERQDLVGALAAAAVQGAQDNGIVATAKHFPGHGDTVMDSHRGLPTVTRSREALLKGDLYPFAQAIKAGVGMVMTAHIHFTSLDGRHPATLSPAILQDLLRKELKFEGVILSDSMNMGAMKRHYMPEEAVVEAITAGVDLVMLAEEHYDHDPENYLKGQVALLNAVREAVRAGKITQARVDEAAGRVLTLKTRFGLLQGAAAVSENSIKDVGKNEHREFELNASQRSVAILQDEHRHIPLPMDMEIILVNSTTHESYKALTGTRGIGPNQIKPAFDFFAEAFRNRRPGTKVLTAEDILSGTSLNGWDGNRLVIAVTENYPLPGMDFDQTSQPKVIRKLMETAAQRLVVVALRDPYELRHFSDVPTYVCAFSFRPCAAEAAVQVLFGETPARGKSPVSIPGTIVQAGSWP
jgi:beta-N-acetylhexosaminidase